jgi:hypothetical protein
MVNWVTKNKTEFLFFDFLFWILLALAFPVAGGNFNFFNIVHIIIYLFAVYYIGEILLNSLDAFRQIPFLFKSGIYIIIGGLVSGLIFLFISSKLPLYFFATAFIADLIILKRNRFYFNWKGVLCLLPFFIMLFQTMELVYGTTERYSFWDGDFYFYTAITESLKTNHSVSNAVLHSGISINYAWLPFLAPAHLAQFSGISSQFALWGVLGKLVPVICFGTLSYVIVKGSAILFEKHLSEVGFFKRQLLASFMLLFLGPLHFLKLQQLDFKNVLFFGEGYILPIGSPGFSLAMFVSGLVFLLIFQKPPWSLLHKAVIIFLLAFIAASKVALFLPLVALLGCLAILGLFKKENSLFWVLLIAMPVCILVFLQTSGSNDATVVTKLTTTQGFYPEYFTDLAEKYGIQGAAVKKVTIMMAISIFMWLSIKLLIFMVAATSLYKNNFKAVSLIVAALFGFIISCLPAFFVNAYGVDGEGKYLFDAKFDMGQFTRAGIFLLTIVACIFALWLVFEHNKRWMRKLSSGLIIFWMLLISMGFFTNNYLKIGTAEAPWYREVQKEYRINKPTLMAMMSNADYSGQALTTAGVHPWYCTGFRANGGGHMMSRMANDRNIGFQKIFDTSISLSLRRLIADSIKKQGVDCIVATPASLHKIKLAEKDSIISLKNGTKWMYEFK